MKNNDGGVALDGAVRALLALRTPGLPRNILVELVRRRGGFSRLTGADLSSAGLHVLAAAWESGAGVARASAELLEWGREGIVAIPFGDRSYPPLLAPIADPPLVLFVQGGGTPMFERPTIGIVGSRRGDPVGCGFAAEVAGEFVRRGGCVVSGLAVGIDGASHRGAIAAGNNEGTIAVLGSGHRSIYPAMHRPLAREIVERGGAVLSQFEPDTRPFPANFLNRNRVIAGLSRGVLVVQAATRSGALVTARCALDEGREVFVVPGGITDPLYGGSNRLLRTGATPITSIEDVFESFPIELKPAPSLVSVQGRESPTPALSRAEEQVLGLLDAPHPVHLEALSAVVGEDLHSALLALELGGRIVRLPGNYLQRLGAGS